MPRAKSFDFVYIWNFQCCSGVCRENLTLCVHPTHRSLVQQASRWRNSAWWGAGEMGGVAMMRMSQFCLISIDKTCEQNLHSSHSISINFSFMCMLRSQWMDVPNTVYANHEFPVWISLRTFSTTRSLPPIFTRLFYWKEWTHSQVMSKLELALLQRMPNLKHGTL